MKEIQQAECGQSFTKWWRHTESYPSILATFDERKLTSRLCCCKRSKHGAHGGCHLGFSSQHKPEHSRKMPKRESAVNLTGMGGVYVGGGVGMGSVSSSIMTQNKRKLLQYEKWKVFNGSELKRNQWQNSVFRRHLTNIGPGRRAVGWVLYFYCSIVLLSF